MSSCQQDNEAAAAAAAPTAVNCTVADATAYSEADKQTNVYRVVRRHSTESAGGHIMIPKDRALFSDVLLPSAGQSVRKIREESSTRAPICGAPTCVRASFTRSGWHTSCPEYYYLSEAYIAEPSLLLLRPPSRLVCCRS